MINLCKNRYTDPKPERLTKPVGFFQRAKRTIAAGAMALALVGGTGCAINNATSKNQEADQEFIRLLDEKIIKVLPLPLAKLREETGNLEHDVMPFSDMVRLPNGTEFNVSICELIPKEHTFTVSFPDAEDKKKEYKTDIGEKIEAIRRFRPEAISLEQVIMRINKELILDILLPIDKDIKPATKMENNEYRVILVLCNEKKYTCEMSIGVIRDPEISAKSVANEK